MTRQSDGDMSDIVPARAKMLPAHESGVRSLVAEAKGAPYYPLRSLEDAKSVSDGVVIFEGDWGGQIYLVCPAFAVMCPEHWLEVLLHDFNEIAWPGNDGGARIFYERLAIGSGVSGGMGGGRVTAAVWVHRRFVEIGLEPEIREVVGGQRDRVRGEAGPTEEDRAAYDTLRGT